VITIGVELTLLLAVFGAFVAEGFKPHEQVSLSTMFALLAVIITQIYRIT
jgi:hypothetical protein